MSDHSGSLVLMACAALTLACGGDGGTGPADGPEPPPSTADPVRPPVLGSVGLSPSSHVALRGTTLRLDVRVTSQFGRPMTLPHPVTFASDSPHVASVDASGVVTALAPGPAGISVVVPSGGSTLKASMRLLVVDSMPRDTLVVAWTGSGWRPDTAHVPPGGTVRWAIPPGWSQQDEVVHLFPRDVGGADSVVVRNGIATRTFVTPDTVFFCSMGCWDPPSLGVLVVRAP